PVEDLFFVIILGLHDLVPNTKLPTEFFYDRFIWSGGVQLVLQPNIQLADTQRAAVHGRENLNVGNWAQVKLLRDALFDQIENGLNDALRIVTPNKEEIPMRGFRLEVGQLAVVDAVGINNDLAVRCLAEDFRKPRDRNRTAIDQVT